MPPPTPPPPHADQAGQAAAEPPPQVSRFDQRGIALQTVIIMVVLLAIAGGVAAVLLNRGSEASDQLASADFGLSASSFTNETGCHSAGHGWNGSTCQSLVETNKTDPGSGNCKTLNPRWTYNATDKVCEPPGS